MKSCIENISVKFPSPMDGVSCFIYRLDTPRSDFFVLRSLVFCLVPALVYTH